MEEKRSTALEQEQQEQPEDGACWLQPTDSLAFSVSPIGPTSASNTITRTGSEDGDFSFHNGVSTAGQREEDDNQPLMGEFIWADTPSDQEGRYPRQESGQGDGRHPAVVNRTAAAAAAAETSLTPNERRIRDDGEAVVRVHEADDGTVTNSVDLLPQGTIVSDNSSDCCTDPGAQEDMTRSSGGRGAVSPGVSDKMREETKSNGGRQIPPPAASCRSGHPEYDRDDGAEFLREEAWINHEELEDFSDFVPDWDQGRRAADINHFHPQHPDHPGQKCGSDDLCGETVPSRRQNQRHEARARQLKINSNDAYLRDSNSEISLCELQPVQQPPRPIRRRTRSSLIRERRKLDRVPRSQRLSQVRGHPLGGMTLLELEERQLLDVGIGQMTRLLARRHDKRQRRADADLLRRSARLFRRAKQDREARLSFGADGSARDGNNCCRRHDVHSRGSQNDFIAKGVDAARMRSSAIGRRPASASRGRARPKCSSFSLESEDGFDWDRAEARGSGRSGYVDKGGQRGSGGSNPPMGLYSGGGARCSLRQRRPMSAKPALTCRTGWQPGRTRTRRGQSCGKRRFEGRRNDEEAEGLSEESGDSDVSDLSPFGIVEYADEEEGPFK